VRHKKSHATYWLVPEEGWNTARAWSSAPGGMMEEPDWKSLGRPGLCFRNHSPDRHRHVLNLYYEGAMTEGRVETGR
jgi:hypothetical protein